MAEWADHIPVLLKESIEALHPQPGGRYIDCTVGGGGHAQAILEASVPGGLLLGIDADPQAIETARKRLAPFGEAVLLVNDNFEHLEDICSGHDFRPVQGILFDLGMSWLQIEDASRGFSFQRNGPLNMRYSPLQTLTAADIVNTYREPELADLLERYGEEPRSRQIARHILANRPVHTTGQLARLVERVAGGTRHRIHPATRTFQALRIAVNQELEHLESALAQAVNLLGPQGRLVVISYHSLEDRLVKQFMRREAQGCLCPPETPVCRCGHRPRLKLVTRKVVRPSREEVMTNPRSRSAKMRVAERLPT